MKWVYRTLVILFFAGIVTGVTYYIGVTTTVAENEAGVGVEQTERTDGHHGHHEGGHGRGDHNRMEPDLSLRGWGGFAEVGIKMTFMIILVVLVPQLFARIKNRFSPQQT